MPEAFIYHSVWERPDPEPEKHIWESDLPHCSMCLRNKSSINAACCCTHAEEGLKMIKQGKIKTST